MSKFVINVRALRDPKAIPDLLRKIGARDIVNADTRDEIEHAANELERLRTALKFCGDLAGEELPNAHVGTGAEIVLRHIVRRARDTLEE